MPSFENQFKSVMGKRRSLLNEGKVSVQDGPDAPVAIMVTYLAERSTDPRDRFVHFLRQAKSYEDHYKSQGRKPFTVFGATIDDFRGVLTDPSIPNIAIAGWGSFSSINVPFARDRRKDPRWGRLEWAHLADMATHVKLGNIVMLHCSGFSQEFNPPLGLGIASQHSNILGNPGEPHWTAETYSKDLPPPPITQESDLTYRAIRDSWRLDRHRSLPVPDGMYVTLQSLYNSHLNPTMPVFPNEAAIEDPNLTPYRQFYRAAA